MPISKLDIYLHLDVAFSDNLCQSTESQWVKEVKLRTDLYHSNQIGGELLGRQGVSVEL